MISRLNTDRFKQPPISPAVRGRLRVEQVDTLANLGGAIGCVGVLAASIVVISFWHSGPKAYLLGFLGVFMFVYFLGFRRSVIWRSKPKPALMEEWAYFIRNLHVGVIGALWATMPLVLTPYADANHHLLIVYVSSGLIASAVVIAPTLLAALLISGFVTLGTFVSLLLSHGPLLGALVLIYSSLILVATLHHHKLFISRLLNQVRLEEQGDLKALSDDLRSALHAAEAANVAKSQFLANMSHEIRTPLNGVLGMTQALWMDELTPAQWERVSIIKESGRSLLAVLNDVLDLSKIEAGHMELELIEFDLEEVVQGVCAAFTAIANKSGLSFGLSLHESLKGRWLGDSVRIRQILYNLVSNALKFTSEGQVQVALDLTPEGALRMCVVDTGIGMPAQKIPELFSAFYQTDSSNTRKFGGTGLGLAICRQLSELMGGSISAESVEGEGSRFSVILPLEYVGPSIALRKESILEADRGESETFIADPGPGFRILAAEDNPANQLVLRALLQAFEVTPIVVENGRLAVEAWASGKFDLVFMDIQMPEMDGVTATRIIREEEVRSGRPRTPIYALSANAMAHQVREYIAAGMDGHVAKPINLEELAKVLSRVSAAEWQGDDTNPETVPACQAPGVQAA